jgi:hypothetical protein
VFKSNTEDRWYQFIDEYGGRGYVPFETTDLASGRWTASSSYSLPSSPRHGTVLPVTAAEYERLEQAYGGGAVTLAARHSGKCADVASASTADGATLQQWSCHDGTNQQWQLRDTGDGYVSLIARHSGKCVDVSSRSSADVTGLHQWSCHGGTNQQWRRSAV